MATTFKADFKKAREKFKRLTCRFLEQHFGFKKILSTEEVSESLKGLLDKHSCVDACGFTKNDDLVFLASRVIEVVPYGDNYDCFSLRNKRVSGKGTELQKLARKIQLDLPRPTYHVQTFVNEKDDVLTVAITRTKELVEFIMAREPKIKKANDGTEFWLASWKDLRAAGIKVGVYSVGMDGKKISRS